MFSASYPAAISVRAAVRQLTMMQALMSALPAASAVFLKTFFFLNRKPFKCLLVNLRYLSLSFVYYLLLSYFILENYFLLRDYTGKHQKGNT